MVGSPAAAQLVEPPQPGVEPLQQLGVELGGRHRAEGRDDVAADQPEVPLAGAVLQLGDLEPFLDDLAHANGAARMPLLIDLGLQLSQLDLGLLVGGRGLLEVALLAVSGSTPAYTTARNVPFVASA